MNQPTPIRLSGDLISPEDVAAREQALQIGRMVRKAVAGHDEALVHEIDTFLARAERYHPPGIND